jgi:hypothetical protein
MIEDLHSVPYDCKSCAWTKYPHLGNITNESPFDPKYNRVSDNVWCPIAGRNMSFMGKWTGAVYDDTNVAVDNTRCTSPTGGHLFGAVLGTIILAWLTVQFTRMATSYALIREPQIAKLCFASPPLTSPFISPRQI